MHPTPESTESTASILGRLREQQAEVAADQSTTIPVTGYTDPQIVAKYRFVSYDDVKQIGQRVRGQYEDDQDRLSYSGMDVMVAACDGLYAREKGSRELTLLDPDGAGPLTYSDPRLAETFGWSTTSAREQLLALFKGNRYAVDTHAQLLQRWLSDTSVDIEKLLGEG